MPRLRGTIGAEFVVASMVLLSLFSCDKPRGNAGSGSEPVTTNSVPDSAPSTATQAKAFKPIDNHALPNAHVVTDKILSGGQPEGEEGFVALHELGVKTIISVDGAKPDVEAARKYGMRYVHLPITYSTVTEEQGKAIAKAIDALSGPMYIHCHHGKHRSAAAVAVACVYNGRLQPQQAESVLQTFGTGANYKGLWKAARDAMPLDPQDLRNFQVDFPETAQIPPLADAMVLMDQYSEHLKLIQMVGWKMPQDHPDLEPAHEALQLQEHLHEIGRSEDMQDYPEDFRQMLADGEASAKQLCEVLAVEPLNTEAADAAFAGVSKSCKSCHDAYRN